MVKEFNSNKQEKHYFDDHLETNSEYSLDELTEECLDRFNKVKEDHAKNGREVTRFTLEATDEGDYYGGSYPRFLLKFYRLETDEELEYRKKQYQKYLEAERKTILKKEEALKKKKELESDPDYQKFLKLKKKFNGKK